MREIGADWLMPGLGLPRGAGPDLNRSRCVRASISYRGRSPARDGSGFKPVRVVWSLGANPGSGRAAEGLDPARV